MEAAPRWVLRKVTILANCQKLWQGVGMDLAFPLRSLVPTMDSEVLGVLAGTQAEMSIAQITAVANRGSRQGLTLALGRLVEHGLVTASPANRGSMYSLNRDHVLADAWLAAIKARGVFLDRLRDAVQSLSPRPLHVSIFGSFARHEGGPDSDIDILFVLPRGCAVDDEWEALVRDLGEQVFAWTGNRMEHIAYTEDELLDVVNTKAAIVESWRTEALTVHGPDAASLLKLEA
jgi:hypothetical protein